MIGSSLAGSFRDASIFFSHECIVVSIARSCAIDSFLRNYIGVGFFSAILAVFNLLPALCDTCTAARRTHQLRLSSESYNVLWRPSPAPAAGARGGAGGVAPLRDRRRSV